MKISIPKNEILQLATFKLKVAISLIKSRHLVKRGRSSTGESSNVRTNCGVPPDEVRLDQVAHMPFVSDKRLRYKLSGCPGQTKFFCKKCNVHLCLDKNKNCFASYHGF